MKSKVLCVLTVLLVLPVFLLGLAIFAYPMANRLITDRQMEDQVQTFLEQWEATPVETAPEGAALPEKEHAQLWDAMCRYNESLLETAQAGLSDPWAYSQPSFTLGDYGFSDEVFGVISIPKLDLQMPVYLGATDAHLASGAAHLSQTSLPIGGSGTCVIAGHRGWKGAAYFRYVPELELGDRVSVTNLWETLTYTVVDTQIIQPNEVDEIKIKPDRELLILLTCHPYASGGKQRFLVICERTE